MPSGDNGTGSRQGPRKLGNDSVTFGIEIATAMNTTRHATERQNDVFRTQLGTTCMGTGDSERSLNRQFAIGDVRYDITVKPFSEGTFRATWICTSCNEEGAWAPVSADPGQAAESAIVGLQIHHTFVHRASKTNPPHSTRKPVDQSPDGLEC
jgi:hypothetical protein